MSLFGAASADQEQGRFLFAWLEAHWDAARANAPAGYEQTLVAVAASACDRRDLDAEVAFLGPKAKGLEGATRPLGENAERAEACVALRGARQEEIEKYFAKRERR